MTKPQINKRIFWDVRPETIDYEVSKRFVITRVFDRGEVEDLREIRKFYGDETIKEELLDARWLDPMALHLAVAIYNLPIDEFRCYKLNQWRQEPFRY